MNWIWIKIGKIAASNAALSWHESPIASFRMPVAWKELSNFANVYSPKRKQAAQTEIYWGLNSSRELTIMMSEIQTLNLKLFWLSRWYQILVAFLTRMFCKFPCESDELGIGCVTRYNCQSQNQNFPLRCSFVAGWWHFKII
jgi:hypothetical protein